MKKYMFLMFCLAAGMVAGQAALAQDKAPKTKNRALSILPVEIIYPKGTNSEALSVFPNPASDRLEIRLMAPELRDFKLEIWDQRGKRVMAQQWNGEILEVSALPNGLYLLTLCKDKEAFSQKVIIQH